jgi:spore maturation protein CgeB
MKVLLVGNNWIGGWVDYCARAFDQLGYEAHIFYCNRQSSLLEIVDQRYARLKARVIASGVRVRSQVNLQINKKLIWHIGKLKPDSVVFVGFVNDITASTLEYIKARYKLPIVMWSGDNPWNFPRLLDKIPHYDIFFQANPFLLTKIKEAGCRNVFYLPFACDPTLHRKIQLSDREASVYGSDVSYIGSLWPGSNFYNDRIESLSHLIQTEPHMDLKIWSISRSSLLNEFPIVEKYVEKMPVFGRRAVKVYNSSKVNLNFNHVMNEGFGNMKLFEIAGCGAFQLCNKKSSARKIVDYLDFVKHIACFDGLTEMKDMLKYYVEHSNERLEIASQVQELVYKNHTYKHRITDLMDVVKRVS